MQRNKVKIEKKKIQNIMKHFKNCKYIQIILRFIKILSCGPPVTDKWSKTLCAVGIERVTIFYLYWETTLIKSKGGYRRKLVTIKVRS